MREFLRNQSLQFKLQFLLAGVIVALGGAILAGLSYLSVKQADEAIRRDAHTNAAMLDLLLQQRSSSMTQQCTLLARQPVLRELIGAGDQATISESVTEYLKQLNADGAVVTGQNGKELGWSGYAAPRFDAVSPGVQSALGGNNWSGVVMDNGRLLQAVTVPVYTGENLVGTFTAVREINSSLAGQLKASIGVDVVFEADGKTLGSSSDNLPAIPISSRPDVLHTVTSGDKKYFAYCSEIAGLDGSTASIRLVTLQNYGTELAPYRRFQAAVALVIGFALLVALFSGNILARHLTKPLGSVIHAAQALKSGTWPAPFESPASDEIGLLQSVFNEMTKTLQEDQARLTAQINSDPLTGLENHRRFQERLNQEVLRSCESGAPLSLLLCDLDYFKQYNSKHGHMAGDEALKTFAESMQALLPQTSILCRYGGEEFAAIVPGKTIEALADVAKPLLERTRSHFKGELTVSMGIAELQPSVNRSDSLILSSELAVSKAKQLGRDRISCFDSVDEDAGGTGASGLESFLKDGSLATIQALAAAVDAKDPYTQGHSANVADYASQLGRYMGYPSEFVELIRITGTLHDVGKIGVPDAILKKPDKLTEEERTIMETHPVLGEVIVRKAPQLAPTLPGVRHHHERWDGKGYPDKLSGENIPLIARVLAVADTYDAMTSDRPYRAGLNPLFALNVIKDEAGTQFDPVLAPAFVEMMNKILGRKAA